MRSAHNRYLLGLWLARWGFAVLVAAVIVIALAAALTVTPPVSLPTIALQATTVYRVEIGAAVFVALYLGSMAFALALQNRGFTEIGTGGIRAQDLKSVTREEDHVSSDLIEELFDEIQELSAKWEVIANGR